MKSKSKFFKISLIIVVTLLVVFSLSSCKKKDNESKPVANPSALINKDSVVLSDSSNQSIVNVPVPVISVSEKLEKPATTVNNDTEALKEDKTPSVNFVENKNDKTEIIIPEKEAPIIPTTPTFVNASNNNIHARYFKNNASDKLEENEYIKNVNNWGEIYRCLMMNENLIDKE